MIHKIQIVTFAFLFSLSIASYATENTSHIELSQYDIGRIELNKRSDIKQAQVLSDESDAFTDKITKCAESKKLQRFECYCLHPKEITHLKNTYEKLIELYPAWKDNEIFWQRKDSGHNVSFQILLGKLRFMLFETKCPT